MIKKYTAIVFILLAGSVFFAHAIIPHHDYQSNICFYDSTCEADGGNHSKAIPNSNENNDKEENSSDNCILATISFITDQQDKNHLDQSQINEIAGFATCFQVIFLDEQLLSPIPLITNYNFLPFLALKLKAADLVTSGLRAPPLA